MRGVVGLLVLLLTLTPAPAPAAQHAPGDLGAWWDRNHADLPLPPLIAHADVEARLKQVAASDPAFFRLAEIGRSVEGRALYHLAFGRGAFPVLLWSQMHGDEPTATRALFDLVAYLHAGRARPEVTRILDALTIHVVPMLNPDGAARFQRRNAQGIDINRDALMLQTPEGRALKALRDRLEPRLGFNLHNQNWRTSVAESGRPASISLLAVAYDEARSDNPGRLLAKKVAGIIRDAVEASMPGQVAKYDDTFEPRAFGDNLTKWGTPVVLIETGPHQDRRPDVPLVRVNFVALVLALDALATGRAESATTDAYESLPFNGSSVLYQLVRRARIVMGNGVPPFLADIGITGTRAVRGEGAARRVVVVKRIDEWGDLSVFGALEVIDGTSLTAAPLWREDLAQGMTVTLPDFAAAPAKTPLGPSQPANLVLLRPLDDGRFRVERVIRAEEEGR
ncbi:MAG: M14 metallopeptidase family protein [Acidobacteriota bacterium]